MSDPQPDGLLYSSLFGSHFTLDGWAEQSIMISCQDSPGERIEVFVERYRELTHARAK